LKGYNSMVFCGQCGLHLPSGTARCPRCGAVADTTPDTGVNTFPTDTPTVESLLHARPPQANVYANAPYPSAPFAPSEQQKLVLHAGSGGDYGGLPDDNAPTRVLDGADYRTQQHTPVNFQSTPPYSSELHNAGYPAQAHNIYNKADYASANYAYTGNIPPGGGVPTGYPPAPSTQQKKRRTLPILVALLGFLLIIGVSTFFAVERFHLLDKAGGVNNGITTPLSPVKQAKGVVQQYYADINNKNYQEAYSLWKWGANAPSFATFKRGYANTEYDALTISNATQLGDGTVKVALTIVATERVAGRVQYHTYNGYYIVGQDGGTWKILRGVLNLAK